MDMSHSVKMLMSRMLDVLPKFWKNKNRYYKQRVLMQAS